MSRFLRLSVGIAAVLVSASAALAGPVPDSTEVTVTTSNMQGWAFSNADNSGTTGTGQIVYGPDTPVLGNGSAQLTVGNGQSSEVLFSLFGAGTKVADLTTLAYSTYVTSSTPGSGAAPALSFDISYNGESTYSGRLVFDPGLTRNVVNGEWQTWDATSAQAWYFSRQPGFADCQLNNGTYCTLAQVVAFFPNLTINDTIFKVGSGQASFDGNVDALQFGTASNSTTVNFDVPEPISLGLLSVGVAAALVTRRRTGRAVPAV